MAILLATSYAKPRGAGAGTPVLTPTLVFKDAPVYYGVRGINGGTPPQMPTLVMKTITAQEGPGGGGGTVGSAI